MGLETERDPRIPMIESAVIPPTTTEEALGKALNRMDLLEQGSNLRGPELAAFLAGQGVTPSTYYHWKRRQAAGGFAALIRKTRSDRGRRRQLPAEVSVLLEGWWLDPTRPSARKCYRRLLAVWPSLFRKEYPQIARIAQIKETQASNASEDGNAKPPQRRQPPSYATVLAALREIPRPMASLARRGKRHFRDHYEETILRERPEQPNLWWVGDHHQFDCFVAVPRRRAPGCRAVRPWITAWMDCSNNLIVGYTINLQPNAQEIALAFRGAVLGRGTATPSRGVGSPCGIPANVLIDNGKDYLSIPLASLFAELNIAVHHAEQYHGQSKPIERWFGVVEPEAIREYPGWCGSSPKERPENFDAAKLAESGKLLTLDEFQVRFAQDLHYRIHRLPVEGMGASPAERFQAQVAAGFVPLIPRTEALDLLLLRKTDRLVMRWGFTLFGRDDFYQSEFMGELIGERVDVLYDPAALGVVKVFFKGVYMGEAVAGQRMAWGTDSSALKEALAMRRRRIQTMQEDIANRRRIAAGISDLELIAEERRIQAFELESLNLAVNAASPAAAAAVTMLLPRAGTLAPRERIEKHLTAAIAPAAPEAKEELLFGSAVERDHYLKLHNKVGDQS